VPADLCVAAAIRLWRSAVAILSPIRWSAITFDNW